MGYWSDRNFFFPKCYCLRDKNFSGPFSWANLRELNNYEMSFLFILSFDYMRFVIELI